MLRQPTAVGHPLSLLTPPLAIVQPTMSTPTTLDDIAARATARARERMSELFPSDALADEVDTAMALTEDADDSLAEKAFAAARKEYDAALKLLASGDAADSHLALRVERLRIRCFVGSSVAALAMGDGEAALANAHKAFTESAFDEGVDIAARVIGANASAQLALGNLEACVLACADAIRRGCDVSSPDVFPPEAVAAARDVAGEACEIPLDRFVMLTMRLNRTSEDLERIRGALQMIPHVDKRDESGNNMLWGALMGAARVAIDEGTTEAEETVPLVRMLLTEQGSRVNQVFDNGSTPLHLAAASGVLGVVEAVLEAGADIDARDDAGRTALIMACQRKLGENEAPRVIETLIGAGSNIEARDNNGLTALHTACKIGNDVAVETLLKAKADWRARTPTGESPVMLGYLRARQSGVVAAILKHAQSLSGDDAFVGETQLFRRASGEGKSPAERCVEEDIKLVKWCEREKEIGRTICKIDGVSLTSGGGKILSFPEDESFTPEIRDAITAAYMAACDFELDDSSKGNVGLALYKKYGDVLSAFVKYNQSAFPISLRESYADLDYNENLPMDFIARAVYAKAQVCGAKHIGTPSKIAAASLLSPLFVAFESTMAQSVDHTFGFAPIIVEKARAMFLTQESCVCLSRGSTYAAARLRDDLNVCTAVYVIQSDPDSSSKTRSLFVEDATIVSASEFGAKTLESHASSALFVACEPSDSVLAGVAAEAYAGSVIITAHARADDSSVASAMNARGFKEDLAKRAISFTASGRPYLFALWTR